jgi:hypothetical protein
MHPTCTPIAASSVQCGRNRLEKWLPADAASRTDAFAGDTVTSTTTPKMPFSRPS